MPRCTSRSPRGQTAHATALEVLRAAEELPEYKDPLTLNGMLRAYEGYLGGGQSTPARAEDFLDSYAIALTAGAEGESRSVLAGITEDSRLRSAMETGYRRGAELSKGKRLAQHLGSAGAAALEEHGYRYPEEFGAFYQAGQEGLSFPEAKRMAGVSGLGEVRKAVFTAAWEAGRKDGNDYEETSGYDLGFEENHGGNAVSLDRSERAGRMGAREPAQDLAGGAGKAEVSAKSLGITNGTDRKTARVLRDTELTDGMRGIRKDARERGLRVDFIRGSLELQVAGRTLNARGAQVGNRLIVQADNPSASFREIYRHERLHAQIARGDIPLAQAVEAVRRAIGIESWERLLPEYRKAYEGVYTGERFERNVQEELCADAASGLLKGHGAVDLSGLEQGQKNSAPAGAEDVNERYAILYPEYSAENIERNIQELANMQTVAVIPAEKLQDSGKRLKDMYLEYFEQQGGMLYSERFGDIALTNSSMRSEIRHGSTAEKIAGIEAIKPVVDRGTVISYIKKNEKGLVRIVVAAPIKIGSESYYMGVMLQRDQQNQRLYLHDVYMEEETEVALSEHLSTTGPKNDNNDLFLTNILRDALRVKQKNRFSVSTPERDSAGRELSAEQAEYFKDSKVRDKDGNLLVMYHQTDGAFTVFDTKHDGAGARDNETPFGIFLKTTDRDIGVRGKNQMALYANITNPLHAENRADLVRQLRRLSPEYDRLKTESGKLDAEYGKKHEAAKKAFVDFLVQWRRDNPTASRSAIYDDPEFNAVYDAEDNVVTEWQERQTALDTQAKEAITEALRKNGYDGVILARDAGSFGRSTDAYIALDANQVKNPDNLAPTKNPDIRYSVSEEAEPASSAEYAQMQRGRAPAGPSEREAAEQRKRQVTLLSHMTERAFELRRQFTEGTQRDLRATDIPDVASDLLRFAGRKAMGRSELEQRLSDIAMKAARSQNPMEAYQVAKEEADYLAADMMRNATGQTDEAKDMWDGIRQTLRSGGKPVKLAITGQSRADLEREGGYEHLRKRLMGYAFLSAGGTPVDVFYEQELTPRFPTAFPDTIQNPADQLIRIVEVLDRFRQIFKSPWAGDAAEDTELLSQERCLSFKKEWTGCEVPQSCIKMEMRAKYPSYFYNTLL